MILISVLDRCFSSLFLRQGADTDKRVGQARATQKGWLTPFQTAAAATFVLGLALMLGIFFIGLVQSNSNHSAVVIGIVATSIFNAFA
jgi:1,4-dihydroxy-2-naphthoate octaprenyltransferase